MSGPARPSKATPVFGRGFLLLCFGFAMALLSACGGQGKLFELSVAPHSAPGQAACIKLLRRESPAGAELPVLRLDCRKSTKVAWYTVDLQYRGRAATWVSCSVLAYDGSGRRLWEVPHGLPLQAASNVEPVPAARIQPGGSIHLTYHFFGPAPTVDQYRGSCTALKTAPL